MDNILITSNSNHEINNLIDRLDSVFALKILGKVHHFLGIEVTKDDSGAIHLFQSQYLTDLLQRVRLSNSKAAKTPMSTGKEVTKINECFENPSLYRSMVGAL